LIDCGISSSRYGSIRNYRSDFDCARVDLGGLGDFSNDFSLDSHCNHIPLEQVGLADPLDGLGGPWGENHAPIAQEVYFDYCNDETWLVLGCPYSDDLPVACRRAAYLLFAELLDSCGVFPVFVAYPANFDARVDLAVGTTSTTWTPRVWIHWVTEILCLDWPGRRYVGRLDGYPVTHSGPCLTVKRMKM
jgi:hypothetical protein